MPVSTPNISNYKPFYIQTEGVSSATNTIEFGMVAKTNPFPVLPTPKEPYKNEWKDENGDDEYTNKIYYKSFDFEVSFYIKATESSDNAGDAPALLSASVQNFFAMVKDGTFKVFDSYTNVGYSKVRYNGFKESSYKARGGKWARAIFSVTFRVIDPLRRATLSGGAIVDVEDGE